MPAIQLAHAGRKAATRRPWDGAGALDASDATRGDAPWTPVAPSPIAFDANYPSPTALDQAGLEAIRDAFVAATQRARMAGFQLVEVHCAHGYLLHEFLSPLANQRSDAYGGSLEGRMRFPLEVIAAVRAAWPAQWPLSVRISAIDGIEDGWRLEDSLVFSARCKALGVDLIDVSSGGLLPRYDAPIGPGYQLPFARAIREATGVATMAVGILTEPAQMAALIEDSTADLAALARGALADPNWPLHARIALGDPTGAAAWPAQAQRAYDTARRMARN